MSMGLYRGEEVERCGSSCGRCGESNVVSLPYAERVAVLRFLKEPVSKLSELYDRYPDGGEWGWFAFVVDKGAFAFWNVVEECWQLVSNENPEQLLRLVNHQFNDGETFVWDAETEHFVMKRLTMWGIEEY